MIYKEILTRDEVMEILKIGKSTFYKLLHTGELKGFREVTDTKFLLNQLRNMLTEE